MQLWLPETNGPVDAADPAHRALVMLLGAQSKREVLRARFRVLAAMRAQVLEQGRYLGGCPHTATVWSMLGRTPMPRTRGGVAGCSDWNPTLSLPGMCGGCSPSVLPCPSSADPGRNRHRSGVGWTLRTVATILANPRYTGRQGVEPTTHRPRLRRHGQEAGGATLEPPGDWVISKVLAHPALVSEGDFIAAQAVDATPTPADGAARRHALVGLVVCRVCGRRMDSHWVHGRPGYRCRYGDTSASCIYARTGSLPASAPTSRIRNHSSQPSSPRTFAPKASQSCATPVRAPSSPRTQPANDSYS